VAPPPQIRWRSFSRHWRCTLAIGFARMNLELTAAGLATIRLLTANNHPIVTVILVAHAAQRALGRRQQGVEQSRSRFFWNDRTNSFWYLNATHPANCDLFAETTTLLYNYF
jgi:hypothetical protein